MFLPMAKFLYTLYQWDSYHILDTYLLIFNLYNLFILTSLFIF